MKITKHAKSLAVAALALALVCVAFAFTTKANAATIDGMTVTYNTATDSIDLVDQGSTMDGAPVKVYIMKSADAELTAKQVSKPDLTTTVSGASVSFKLGEKDKDKKAGIKVAENKPLYLYIVVSGAAVEKSKANFKLAPTDIKKIDSIVVDYGKVYDGNTTDKVLTVKATTTAEGAESAALALDKVAVTDIKVGSDKKKVPTAIGSTGNDVTGKAVYDLIIETYKDSKGKDKSVKHTLSVQAIGSSTSVTVDKETFDGRRNSKAKTVGLKAPAAGKAVKVDYLKGTIALKSGYDFVVVATGGSIAATAWNTILPADSTNGTYTTEVYKQTITYSYVKKLGDKATADDKANFYKGDKIKSLGLQSICGAAWTESASYGVSPTAIIYVRKTATDKAPASFASEAIKVAEPLDAPVITVTNGAIAATYDAKKGFTLTAANIKGANANGGYEYLVVPKTQVANVDLANSKWTKFDPAKPLKTALKSTVVYKTAVNNETKVAVSTVDDSKNLKTDFYILVRGAGVKEKASKGVVTVKGALPTGYVKTEITSTGSGDNVVVQWKLVD